VTAESLGCARCGACCDPVLLSSESVRILEDASAIGDQQTKTFAAEHWHQRGEPDGDGWVRYDCDQFDPDTRLCAAGDGRPPVCRYYPWYIDGPTAERAGGLHPQCSYLLDVAPAGRPEGARPLIPIEVVR
jgi:Fe-S-cluster containining protein